MKTTRDHHPPPDAREARELSPDENADLCTGCVACCTYITVEIDTPRAAWEYDQWIWALHHDAINIYLERPEKWFLHVTTRCSKLGTSGRCTIYGRHPVLCREYDPRECERRLPLADQRAWFKTGEELEGWLASERPGHYRRLMAHRRDFTPGATNGHGVDGSTADGHGAASGSNGRGASAANGDALVQIAGLTLPRAVPTRRGG